MRLQKVIVSVLFLLIVSIGPNTAFTLDVMINGERVSDPSNIPGEIGGFEFNGGSAFVTEGRTVDLMGLSVGQISAPNGGTLTIVLTHVFPFKDGALYGYGTAAGGQFLGSLSGGISVNAVAENDVISTSPAIQEGHPRHPEGTVTSLVPTLMFGSFGDRTEELDILCPGLIDGNICFPTFKLTINLDFQHPGDGLILNGGVAMAGARIPGDGGIVSVRDALAQFAIPSVRPFADFNAKLKIDLDRLAGIPYVGFRANDDEFAVKAFFRLGDGSDGIDPVTEDVRLQVGTFSTTIPAGRFRQLSPLLGGGWTFVGVINGVNLEATIQPFGPTSYLFKAAGTRADLTGTTNPVLVGLSIGNDGGSTSVEADFD